MKKLWSVLFWLVIGSIVLFYIVYFFASIFGFAERIGKGNALWGIVQVPFVIVGIVQIIRGIGEVMEKDGEKLPNTNFAAVMYFLITILGIIAVGSNFDLIF